MKNVRKMSALSAVLAVAGVLFGSHAGGGFATGNQETQYYVQYGWTAPVAAILAMVLLTATLRVVIIMYNNFDCENYKDLFKILWNPYPKLAISWEIYYYLMVAIAVSAVIAGAASVFQSLGMPYILAVFIVGATLLLLTIFGAVFVSGASGIMSVIILLCSLLIFITGIKIKVPEITQIFTEKQFWGDSMIKPFTVVFTYAGFQSVVIPAVAASSKALLKNEREATLSMFISFLMNAVALCLAVTMLLGWYGDFTAAGQTTLPTLYVATHSGVPIVATAYKISLFLCLISTGVTTIFGMVNRFENAEKLMFIQNKKGRRAFIACLIMVVAILLSLTGLTNLVKYGYGYCGYIGIFAIIIPFLTIGVYKNRKFKKEHPNHKWKVERDLEEL